jgi:hypothetical protein
VFNKKVLRKIYKPRKNDDDSLLGYCAVAVPQKFTDVSEVLTASIIRAAQYPRRFLFHTGRGENLKSHIGKIKLVSNL